MTYKETPLWKTKKTIRECPEHLKLYLEERLNLPLDYRFVFKYFENWDYLVENDLLYLYIADICFIISINNPEIESEIHFGIANFMEFKSSLSNPKCYNKDFLQIPHVTTLYEFIRRCNEIHLKLSWKNP